MKNKFTLCLLAGGLLLSSLSFAGGSTSKKGDGGDVFSEKSLLLNIGIGIPSWHDYAYGSGYYGYFSTPSFSGSLEAGIHKWISVGGFLEFDVSGYTLNYPNQYIYYNGGYTQYTYTQTYTYTHVAGGAKGSFHFSAIGNEKWGWNINTSKIDLYASAFIGIGIDGSSYSYTYTGNSPYSNSTANNGTSVHPALGVAAGARYLFTPSFGVFGEVGPSPLGWVVGGVTFKIK